MQTDEHRLDNPTEQLKDIFPDGLSDGTFHIMIADSSVFEILDTLDDPDAPYKRKIRKALDVTLGKLPSKHSPSEIVKDAGNLKVLFEDNKLYRNQVPVALFNGALANLQARLEKNDDTVSSYEVDRAGAYIARATEFYDNDEQRQNAICEIIDSAFGAGGWWGGTLGWADNIRPDGSWLVNLFPSIILELTNIPGVDGNPVLQCIADLGKIIASSKYNEFRGSCNFPVVLIGVAGSRLQISIAVYVGAIFVSDLLTIDVSLGFHGSHTTIRLAHIFKALALCRQELKGYYENIRPSPRSDCSFLYPQPVTANNTALPIIKYDKYLGLDGLPTETVPNLGERSTAIYTGSLETGERVLIKFTHRYNKEVHTLLAEAGLAPRLHFFSPIVGDLMMIVIEYIGDGKSIWRLKYEEMTLPCTIPDQVERAITILHGRDIVFGDLRGGNIMYIEDRAGDGTEGRVMLVDFDWAGFHEKDRYSARLNIDGGWADGVCRYGIMRKEHDLWQLERLRELCDPKKS